MFLIDSHCHIDRLNYNLLHKNTEDVLKKAYKNHIKKFLTISTSINNFYKTQKMLKEYSSVFYSCGIHPLKCKEELNNFNDINSIFNKIEELSYIKNVISIGETGLDYYRSNNNKKIQKYFFRKHIQIAIKKNKPLIVHSRCSIDDTIKILKEENAEKCRGILHSFNESSDAVYKLLDMGFYISFSGIVTFKNASQLYNTINKVPLDRLLIETDSPYLSPEPYRGKENQPAYLLYIAKKISILKKIKIEKLAEITTNNFHMLFNIKQD